MSNSVIAKAVSIAGEAYAHNDRGELRILAEGDVLSDGETVVTPDGSWVNLEMLDGSILSVSELSGRKLHRDMLAAKPAQARRAAPGKQAGALTLEDLRISSAADGGAVRTAEGQNLFFNELPLYWVLDAAGRTGRAVAHAGSGGTLQDQTAFSLTLADDGSGAVVVSPGAFSVETHNIPFTTGDPRPGLPVVFFGIPEEVESSADSGPGVLSADLTGIGYSNNWYREGRDIVFEFLGKSPVHAVAPESPATKAAGTRAINSFSFRNSGAAAASFVARAYRGNDPGPVYQAGSDESPVHISAGGIFTVCSEFNYDRLVLSHPDSYAGSGLKLSLEGYCEFAPATSMNMALAACCRVAGERVTGDLMFTLGDVPGPASDVRFLPVHAGPASATPVFDSVWEELG